MRSLRVKAFIGLVLLFAAAFAVYLVTSPENPSTHPIVFVPRNGSPIRRVIAPAGVRLEVKAGVVYIDGKPLSN